MEKYLGVKLIEAESRQQHECTNKDCPEGIEGYKVIHEDGYESWSPKDVFEKAYRKIKTLDDLSNPFNNYSVDSHQWRTINEARELDNKILQLDNFIYNLDGVIFETLPVEEQSRLCQQLMAMQYYLTILVERIENFK